MRGTSAVIGIVLLVVFAAHLRREEARGDADFGSPSMAYQAPSGGCTATDDIEEAEAEATIASNDAP